MTEKRFTVLKKLENSDIEADVIDTYIERLVKDGKSVGWVTVGILDKGNPITYKDCVDLLNKNEQLKKELKIYRKIASCSNCKYQNYDWFDDGDEFEICERGNNGQQIEYHICEDWREL